MFVLAKHLVFASGPKRGSHLHIAQGEIIAHKHEQETQTKLVLCAKALFNLSIRLLSLLLPQTTVSLL